MVMNTLLGMALGTILGLFFLVAKALLRHLSHKVIAAPSDLWLIPAWFGVDLCIISLSSVLVGRLLLPHSYVGIILHILVWCVLLFGSICGYTQFVKRRRRCRKKNPARDRRLAFALTLGLFCGCIPLIWTANQFLSVAFASQDGASSVEQQK